MRLYSCSTLTGNFGWAGKVLAMRVRGCKLVFSSTHNTISSKLKRRVYKELISCMLLTNASSRGASGDSHRWCRQGNRFVTTQNASNYRCWNTTHYFCCHQLTCVLPCNPTVKVNAPSYQVAHKLSWTNTMLLEGKKPGVFPVAWNHIVLRYLVKVNRLAHLRMWRSPIPTYSLVLWKVSPDANINTARARFANPTGIVDRRNQLVNMSCCSFVSSIRILEMRPCISSFSVSPYRNYLPLFPTPFSGCVY